MTSVEESNLKSVSRSQLVSDGRRGHSDSSTAGDKNSDHAWRNLLNTTEETPSTITEFGEPIGKPQEPIRETQPISRPGFSSSQYPKKKKYQVDQGWSWVVCLASVVLYGFSLGTKFTSGLVFAKLLQPPCNATMKSNCGGFGHSAARTAWVFSIYAAVIQGGTPICSWLIKQLGCQLVVVVASLMLGLSYIASAYVPNLELLYLTYGVVAGMAASLIYSSVIFMIGKYFEKRRDLANGIALSGAGLGTLLISAIAYLTLDRYSWRGFFRVMAMSGPISAIASLTFRPPSEKKLLRIYVRRFSDFQGSPKPKSPLAEERPRLWTNSLGSRAPLEKKSRQKQPKPINHYKVLKKVTPLLMTTGFMMYDTMFFVPYIFTVQLNPKDFSLNIKRTLFAGSMLALGAILLAAVSNHRKTNPCLVQAAGYALMGLSCIIPMTSSGLVEVDTFCFLYGFANGGTWALFVPTMIFVVGLHKLSKALGMIFFFGSIGSLVGPPFAGYIFDTTKSLTNVFALPLACFLFGCILLVSIYFLVCLTRKRVSFPNQSEVVSVPGKELPRINSRSHVGQLITQIMSQALDLNTLVQSQDNEADTNVASNTCDCKKDPSALSESRDMRVNTFQACHEGALISH